MAVTLLRIAPPLASALLLVLATPPFDLWPLAFVCLIPLYISIRDAPPLRAAGMAWFMGFAAILGACTWWAPFLHRFAHLSWASSMALTIGLCAYQTLVFALWAGVYSLLTRRNRLRWLLAGPLVIIPAEAAFPFIFKMYLAITLWRAWPFVQAAELGGPPAVSALMVLANLVLAETGLALLKGSRPHRAVGFGAAALILVVTLGLSRAAHVDALRRTSPAIKVGLVQPNFGIVSSEERRRHGEKYIKALRKAAKALAREHVDLIVWPETSWPYLLDRHMKREFPPGHPWELRPGVKGRLLLGALTHAFGGAHIYNSAVLVSGTGSISGWYDKNRLVPFAEYIPFARRFPEWAKRLRARLPDWPDIEPGKKTPILEDGHLRIGPLICSEDLNMGLAHKAARQRPNLLVSIASDAWFGDRAAPRQHLALAAFRAVETRRDLVRDTNTGVSAIVDALGRVPLEGELVDVPENEPRPATTLSGHVRLMEIFAFGPYTARFLPFICLAALAAAMVRRRKGG